MKKNLFFVVLVIFVLILYYPSLFVFYTNDDFFHLKLAEVSDFSQFVNFFDFTKKPLNFGSYRPLTTQAFYFLGRYLFNLNPFYLHVLSFMVFFGILFLVFRLLVQIFNDEKTAQLGTFFYAVTPLHFGHLYFLGAFQELGLTFFFLISIINNIYFVRSNNIKYYSAALISFILSLLSKETAIMFPIALFITLVFMKYTKKINTSYLYIFRSLVVFFLITLIYLYFHFFHYGFAEGDSYTWDFSVIKTANSGLWYGLWTLGLPEMLLDFVGSGFKINPNLFKFWGKEMLLIFSALVGFLVIIFLSLWNAGKSKKDMSVIVQALFFSIAWFVITLLPVLFLPQHKFTYSLTLPVIGVYGLISCVVIKSKQDFLKYSAAGLFLILAISTLDLTVKTHWITKGSETAKRVYNYIDANKDYLMNKTIVFHDAPRDSELPWQPTQVLKQVLSDNNFFEVFYDEKIVAVYNNDVLLNNSNVVKIPAREFLGY